MVKKDYYIILGVPRSESSAGIHDAFRRLAKLHHPDLGGPEQTETFQEITQAYKTLADPEQRRSYDQSLRRQEGLARPEPLIPDPMSISRDFQTVRPSLDALFDRMLRNFTGLNVPKGERIQGLNIEIAVSPFEAAQGVVVPIGVPVFGPCALCDGSGRDWLFPCIACDGQGRTAREVTVQIRIPPMSHDHTVIEVPIDGLGIHNFYLRLHVRISG